MKTFVVLNQELHPDDLDFIVGVFQAEDSSEIENYLQGMGHTRELDIKQEEIVKLG